jgi:hypothetical protein
MPLTNVSTQGAFAQVTAFLSAYRTTGAFWFAY